MTRWPKSILIVVFGILISACTQAPDEITKSLPQVGEVGITVVGEVSKDSIARISDALKFNIPRITANLGVDEMPHFAVKVWSDPDQFKAVFQNSGGQGGVTRGYVNSAVMEVRVLDGDGVEEVAVHEFAHLAMLVVNPTIAANPFWLWESVALYEDGSGPPNTRSLTCISVDESLSMAELASHQGETKVYRMGYLIVDFIVENWSREALVSLIKNNGDISQSLGITREQFQSDWHSYLVSKYKFGVEREPMNEDQLIEHFSGNTLTSNELNQSSFLAADGRLFFGSDGIIQREGRWSAASGEICLEIGEGQPRCSKWYQLDTSRYLLDSSSDCVLQEWELSSGNTQGFTSVRN